VYLLMLRCVPVQGERSAVRYLFRKGLEANPRSRYIHLSWGLWEKAQGQVDNARSLFKRGHELNPQDAPILQVCAHPVAPSAFCALCKHKQGLLQP
jgi:hypothetical protein